ncbi:MAG: hypothetical protein KDD42_03980 [Bdellovibrionales bacterium]|nr:hypothetical protein [Bdellovibrionales bacterium]
MKKSCLFVLIGWAVLTAGYSYLLGRQALLEQYWWVAPLLALSTVILYGSLQDLLLSYRRNRALTLSGPEWRDGKYVGATGRIQAIGKPLIAPFSGEQAVLVEYELASGEQDSAIPDYRGMLMTPCAIQTSQGSRRIIGFPLLATLKEKTYSDPGDYQRAANFLLSTEFNTTATNPMTLLKDLNQILNDDDGDVRANFKQSDSTLLDFEEDEKLEELEDSELAASEGPTPAERARLVSERLTQGGYILKEKLIKNGEAVTAFGTYRADRQALDIGGGLQNLSHQISLGSSEEVIKKLIARGVGMLIFWGAVFVVSHYFFLVLLEQDPVGLWLRLREVYEGWVG